MDSSAADFTEPAFPAFAAEVPPLDGETAAAAVKNVWNEPVKGSMAVLGISIWPSLSESKQVSGKSSSSSSGSLTRISVESTPDNISVASSQNLNNGNPIPARNHGAHTHQNFSRHADTRTNRGPARPLPRPVSSQMPGIRESLPQTRPHGGGKIHGGNQRFNNDRVELHQRNNVNIHIQEQRGLNDRRQRNTGIGLQPPLPQGVRPFFRPVVQFSRPTMPVLDPPMPQGVRPFFRPVAQFSRPTMPVLDPFNPYDPRFMPSMGYHDISSPLNYAAAPPTPPVNYTAAPPTPPVNYTATPPPPPLFNYAAALPPTGAVPFPTYRSLSPRSLPVLDAQRMQVLNQVEYYFSPDNLAKNPHLRWNMDSQGWVSVSLIAGFPRILQYTPNIFDDLSRQAFVLDTMSSSAVVEVQDGKMRRRNDWDKWTITVDPSLNNSDPQSSTTPSINTITPIQGVALEVTANQNSSSEQTCNGGVTPRTTSGNLPTQLHFGNLTVQLPFVGVLTGAESGQLKD